MTWSAASSIEANIFRPVMLYPPSTRRARALSGRSPISDVVPGSEKLPPISLRCRTTRSAISSFAARADLGALQHRHDDGGVHVERERGGRAALAQRLVGDRVVEEAGAGAAPLLADGEFEKPFRAKPVVVLGRMRCVAVVVGRTGGEVGCQVQATLLQALLVLGEREIHPPGLANAQPRASA